MPAVTASDLNGRGLLTKADVAQMFHCSIRTVERLVATGQLHPIRTGASGRRLMRFTEREVLELLNSRLRESHAAVS
jgi:DNA-binding transcriptional MerR regulator